MSKRALVIGVSGQDGAYLSQLLLDKGYEVWGTSRAAPGSNFAGLDALGIRERVRLLSVTPTDFRSVLMSLAQVEPDEVYYLAGQSSVGVSFEQPVETFESSAVGILNLLEAARFRNKSVRIYNAASAECFGDTGNMAADENTPFRPGSPYAVAKAAAFWQVAAYRDAYGTWACSGILFNHESPLRSHRFVTRKIVSSAVRIAAGVDERLRLGTLSVERDWGWAAEYVEAMWRMLQQPRPQDFVIATGETHPLEAFVAEAFRQVGLDWKAHTTIDETLKRPSDIAVCRANPAKAWEVLGWRATSRMESVVKKMIEGERASRDARYRR
jgi:GDPmannose 4,6-dehydratase